MSKKTFETAITRLTEIADKMNDADLQLEESMKLYKEAVELAEYCKKHIESAKAVLETIESADAGES